MGALILLNPEGGQTGIALWGPAIGITIRDREKAARERLDQGSPSTGHRCCRHSGSNRCAQR